MWRASLMAVLVRGKVVAEKRWFKVVWGDAWEEGRGVVGEAPGGAYCARDLAQCTGVLNGCKVLEGALDGDIVDQVGYPPAESHVRARD